MRQELEHSIQNRLVLRLISKEEDILDLAMNEVEPQPGHQLAPLKNIAQQLIQCGCKTVLVQDPILDKEYQSEFKAFYSTTFVEHSRYSKRLHFFSLTANAEESPLSFIDRAYAAWDRNGNPVQTTDYLGFVTLRPIKSCPIGRTVLAAPVSCSYLTVKDTFRTTLAGRTFHVLGAPFMQQDSAVAACAHISLWMGLRARRRRDGRDAFTIAQIASYAAEGLVFGRILPSAGMALNNMMTVLENLGYHGHLENISKRPGGNPTPAGKREHREKLITALYPYLESGIPVIALFGSSKEFMHSVVLVGHGWDAIDDSHRASVRSIKISDKRQLDLYTPSAWISELYANNDNAGPYRKIETSGSDYSIENIKSIIPLLPKEVYLSAESAYLVFDAVIQEILLTILNTDALKDTAISFETINKALVVRPYLSPRHEFRKWALENTFGDLRDFYRQKHLPEQLWVFELNLKAGYHAAGVKKSPTQRIGEVVLDPTGDAHDYPLLALHLNFGCLNGKPNGVLIDVEREVKKVSIVYLEDCGTDPYPSYKFEE